MKNKGVVHGAPATGNAQAKMGVTGPGVRATGTVLPVDTMGTGRKMIKGTVAPAMGGKKKTGGMKNC